MLSLLSSAKNFRTNFWVGHARLNRWGLYAWRKNLATWCADLRRARFARQLPAADVQALQQNGMLQIPNFLDAATFAAIRQEIKRAQWSIIEMHQPPAVTRRANLDLQTCQALAPTLAKVIFNPRLLAAIRYAAGCGGNPIAALQIVRTDGQAAGTDPQTDWHVDTFHATAKAWLFLHDVPADQGPFAYVPGSHRPNVAHAQWNHAQSQVAAGDANAMHSSGSLRISHADLHALGYGEEFTAAVPANTLVVADTSGFHRRTPSPEATVRLEIYFSLRRNPFFAGFWPNTLSWPILRERWAAMIYRVYQHQHARGRAAWQPTGVARLQEDEQAKLH
jgi:Phytanoyl-CoA dioxygenase (PhyH)